MPRQAQVEEDELDGQLNQREVNPRQFSQQQRQSPQLSDFVDISQSSTAPFRGLDIDRSDSGPFAASQKIYAAEHTSRGQDGTDTRQSFLHRQSDNAALPPHRPQAAYDSFSHYPAYTSYSGSSSFQQGGSSYPQSLSLQDYRTYWRPPNTAGVSPSTRDFAHQPEASSSRSVWNHQAPLDAEGGHRLATDRPSPGAFLAENSASELMEPQLNVRPASSGKSTSESDRQRTASPPSNTSQLDKAIPTATPFITKLAHLLDNPKYSEFIRWNIDGTIFTFAHKSPQLLEVFSTLFRHANMASFVRQLNIYGFVRLNQAEVHNACEASPYSSETEFSGFWHPLFFRGSPDQPCDLSQIKPKGGKKVKVGRRKTIETSQPTSYTSSQVSAQLHDASPHAVATGLPAQSWPYGQEYASTATYFGDPVLEHQQQQQQGWHPSAFQYVAGPTEEPRTTFSSASQYQQHDLDQIQQIQYQQEMQQQHHPQQHRYLYQPYPPFRRGNSFQG